MADDGMGGWPRRRARIRPETTALRQGGRELSYAALADRVDRLATAFAVHGVRHGDRVAYLGWNDIAAFETFFAAARCGAIFVPLNVRLAAPEISTLIKDAAPAALVHDDAHRALARSAGATAGLPAGPERIEELIAEASTGPTVQTPVAMDDDAVILYTSGTTGRPKGAVLTHRNVVFNTMNQLAHVDVLSTDRALCIAPLFHATGLGQVSLPTFFKGGTVVVKPRFDAESVLSDIEELGITAFCGVPTMLQMMCDHPAWPGTDLGSLRYVIHGGSPIPERVALAWQRRGVEMLQGYGMTEAAPGVALAAPGRAAQRPLSAGPAHFFTDIRLRRLPGGPEADESERMDETETEGGTEGELLVRGPNVFRGYWQRPDETAAALQDGWFRSGDVVRLDPDGWISVVGRVKDMIISGGENIYPAEVEASINALPGVVDSAVVGVPDEAWGEVGVAYVIPAAPGALTEQAVRDALRGRIAGYKIPRRVRLVDHLPRTATGKVVKSELARITEGLPHAT
jgi:fatty-acyl-CoA synthase